MADLTYRSQAAMPLAAEGSAINVSSRWCIWLLSMCATAIVAARIVTLDSPDPNREGPFLSANDRSRWCTVKSLVEYHTFAIDAVIAGAEGAPWDTIDKVFHAGPDGQMHFYSSKPPMWPTFLAGQYWLARQVLGHDLESRDFLIPRLMLILNNALALGVLVWLVGRIAEALTGNPRTQMFVAAAMAFGTSLTTFAVTLNNHLPAALCVAASAWLLIRIWRHEGGVPSYIALGLCAALAAALELPALGWLAVVLAIALLRSPLRTLACAVPAAAVVAAAFFFANERAHGTWRPAYDFRSDGAILATVAGDLDPALDRGELPDPVFQAIEREASALGFRIESSAPVVRQPGMDGAAPEGRRWIVNRDRPDQLVIEGTEVPQEHRLRQWRNWYDYQGSYWSTDNERKSPVDRGEPDPQRYLLHMTVGHHGVLPATPIFLFSLLGVLPLMVSRRYGVRLIALASIILTVTVFAFYVTRPVIDRNYGGVTSGLRWVFWLYPLWMMWMIPVLDWTLGNRLMRLVASILLGISIFSAGIAWSNPWTHPWTVDVWRAWTGG